MIRFQSHNGFGAASLPTLFVSLLLLMLAGCDWRVPKTLPGQIVGEWKTDDSRYQGRFLRLETDQITFGLGGAAPDELERIESVRMMPSDQPTAYVIQLRKVSGTTDSIALRFTPENGGELRIKSQPKVVWTRKADAGRALPVKSPPATLPLDVLLGQHRTIYKIDCIRPKVCRSY